MLAPHEFAGAPDFAQVRADPAQLLPRVLRLLASKSVRPNWHELGSLVLKESSTEREAAQHAEHIRLRIAGAYFSAQSQDKKAL